MKPLDTALVTPSPSQVEKDQVSALSRGLQILDCFKSTERFLSNQELAECTGLPKATVFRLAHTLVSHGYLEYSVARGKFYLGNHLISLGFTVLGSLNVRQVARPLMRELAEQSSASVGIGARDKRKMIYVENSASAANYNFRLNIGSRLPIATTAMGRAYFCGLTEEEREQFLSEVAERSADEYRETKALLEIGLQSYRDHGFCVSIGEWQSDVNAVGVPFRSADGTTVLAFNCCGPAFQLTADGIMEKWGPRLVNLVRNVEAAAVLA